MVGNNSRDLVPYRQSLAWSHKLKIRGRPLFALIGMSFLWGYSWTGIKIGLLDASPFTFAALRMGIGAACLLLALWMTGRPFLPQRVPELIKLGLVQTAALMTLSTWAVAEGTAGRAAFLAYTMPFFTLLMAWPFLGERVRGLQWLSMFLAACGLTVIVEPWNMSGKLTSSLRGVSVGFTWALGAIMVKRIQQREPMDLISMTAWQMFLGSLPLIALALWLPETPVIWSTRFITVLLLVSVVTTAFGWILWFYVLNKLPAGTASMGTLAAPIVAMLSSAYHLGERPSLVEFIGISLIGSALLILSYNALREHRELPSATIHGEGA